MRSFVSVNPSFLIFLKPLAGLVEGELKLYVDDAQKIDRLGQDGAVTALGTISGQDVGIIYQDFRVNGGSISKQMAQRMIAFINLLCEMKRPVLLLTNSLGVRITQGRTIFDDAFSVIPALFRLKQQAPVITAAIGNTIGISAIYYAQAHYRLSLVNSPLNLAGPEVHRRFFGDKNLTFNKFAQASHQARVNNLIHELAKTQDELFEKIKGLMSILSSTLPNVAPKENSYSLPLKKLLARVGEEVLELFPLRGKDVKVFIAKFGTEKVGLLINPPEQPNNLLTVQSINKTIEALELFKVMALPVVTIIDCPGGDPRQGESDADGLVRMTELVRVMIEYPYKKMGIVHGRCFGGSGMFLFPKIFGGERVLAVNGSQLGIMNETIIKELLVNSPRLLGEWTEIHQTETADLSDMINSGTIDQVIELDDIAPSIQRLIVEHQLDLREKTLTNEERNHLQA